MTAIVETDSGSEIRLTTDGMQKLGHREISVEVPCVDLRDDAKNLLQYIVDYITQSKRVLYPEETMGYGYWLIRFKELDANTLQIWENDPEGKSVKGASLAIQYWRDQQNLCRKLCTKFDPPRPDQLSVISKGVFEGLVVQGVRYPSPPHMSGWWITTDQYDGNIRSLKTEHTYHVTANRPDLAKYLALPYGFRFDLSSFEDVWFDEEVARDTSAV